MVIVPGREDGTLGRIVYEIHHGIGHGEGLTSIHPAALQQLHVAAHVHEISTKLLPAMQSGKLVIFDQFGGHAGYTDESLDFFRGH